MMYFQLAAIIFIASCFSQSNSFELHQSPNGKEYLVKNLKCTYEEARQLCEANNATLVQMKSLDESQWIKDNIQPKHSFFLGVRSVDSSVSAKASTHFLDGTPITWYNWNPGQSTSSHSCAIITVNYSSFKWFQYACSQRWDMAVICEHMPSMTMSSYMEQLVKALDELETTVMKDRANITSLLKENKVLRDDSVKIVGPALGKVIDRIRALTKATR